MHCLHGTERTQPSMFGCIRPEGLRFCLGVCDALPAPRYQRVGGAISQPGTKETSWETLPRLGTTERLSDRIVHRHQHCAATDLEARPHKACEILHSFLNRSSATMAWRRKGIPGPGCRFNVLASIYSLWVRGACGCMLCLAQLAPRHFHIGTFGSNT